MPPPFTAFNFNEPVSDLQRQVGRCVDVAPEQDRNYTTTTKETFDPLSTALRDRFSTKDRVWPMRQMLSARKRESSEPLHKYIEDLQNKFDNLEEKVWFFIQGLRPDTQGEVLMCQPTTFREADKLKPLSLI